ncbi:MAG: GNAT family N-acetyltransferase [Acidaminococcus sp.]|nr:GNAT family N-acetyltransferase [Acidaminococcus sp.]MCI2100934.1 GNAT family N-acetyltransferase [Acidaminococcus sp.]MCI2115267.1 GNAT family N-acetyltransferase [Acidaminococcus sp.]MCI2117330.1 GNAT family N-acetyltransferase [Acidaminococcus sp.]
MWNLRCAEKTDVPQIAALERTCFPAAEAATEASVRDRVAVYPTHFYLLFDGNHLVSFVNGLVTDEPDLTDEMYEKASMHNEKGAWQMIFGVDTDPAYQKKGCAARVLQRFIEDAQKQGRKGVVLTCKDKLIHYYAKFGFVDEGVSESTHGDVVWHQMRLKF